VEGTIALVSVLITQSRRVLLRRLFVDKALLTSIALVSVSVTQSSLVLVAGTSDLKVRLHSSHLDPGQ